MLEQPLSYPSYISNALWLIWLSLQEVLKCELRERYNANFDGVITLTSYWQLDNVAIGLWLLQSAEEYRWGKHQIEECRSETTESFIKKNPGGLDRGNAQ